MYNLQGGARQTNDGVMAKQQQGRRICLMDIDTVFYASRITLMLMLKCVDGCVRLLSFDSNMATYI